MVIKTDFFFLVYKEALKTDFFDRMNNKLLFVQHVMTTEKN